MKNPKRDDELTSWIKDVSSISGRDTLIVTRQETDLSTHLAEKLLLFTVVIALTFAVSAAYYMNYSPATQEHIIESMDKPPVVVSRVVVDKAEKMFGDVMVEIKSETTTLPELVEAVTTTVTTLAIQNKTSIVSCGGDWELPCETREGYKCDVGYIEGSEGLCHKKGCAPSIASGNDDGKCGAYALQYCDEAV